MEALLPDFNDLTLFPPFAGLPSTSQEQEEEEEDDDQDPYRHTTSPPVPPASSSSSPPPALWHLLATIRQDMTITKPTLILADRTGAQFPLVFDGLNATGDIDMRRDLGVRAGSTLVVPRARRAPPRELGKSASARVAPGRARTVRVVPGEVGRVVEVGAWLRERRRGRAKMSGDGKEGLGVAREGEGTGGPVGACCDGCGKATTADGAREGGSAAPTGEVGRALRKCTGCGEVGYCSKECQIRGWNEGGHKADCKIIKAIDEIWG